MGRKPSFEIEDVYKAVARETALKGRFTLQGLTDATGLSMGSIYHRFASRETLLAESWLHALRGFQSEFIEHLRRGSLADGENAALAVPRFCRAEPHLAVILAVCRQADFVSPETPPELAAQVASANSQAAAAIAAFAKRHRRSLLTCKLALVAYPLGAVRLFLPHEPVPESLDIEIARAYRAAMRLPLD